MTHKNASGGESRDFVCAVFILACCGLAVFMQCRISDSPGAGADPIDLLPQDDDISGFKKSGSAIVMTDYTSIMNAIDGAGEKYIDYGFVEGANQFYGNGNITVDVQIMNQGTEKNAQGLYEDFLPSSYEVLSPNEPQVLVDLSISTAYSLLYQRENIFMRISTTEKTDFALNMSKQFYLNIDKKISSEE
jgi:hypothetical protein